ncbi:hypothetical protein OF83DRAFT_604638 [Amylostereum chailletii]|nr:hypothetical protein OF83DRAFT_604638 [Amylostereum chailletii]
MSSLSTRSRLYCIANHSRGRDARWASSSLWVRSLDLRTREGDPYTGIVADRRVAGFFSFLFFSITFASQASPSVQNLMLKLSHSRRDGRTNPASPSPSPSPRSYLSLLSALYLPLNHHIVPNPTGESPPFTSQHCVDPRRRHRESGQLSLIVSRRSQSREPLNTAPRSCSRAFISRSQAPTPACSRAFISRSYPISLPPVISALPTPPTASAIYTPYRKHA